MPFISNLYKSYRLLNRFGYLPGHPGVRFIEEHTDQMTDKLSLYSEIVCHRVNIFPLYNTKEPKNGVQSEKKEIFW